MKGYPTQEQNAPITRQKMNQLPDKSHQWPDVSPSEIAPITRVHFWVILLLGSGACVKLRRKERFEFH